MVNFGQNVAFHDDPMRLPFLLDQLFAHGLEGKQFAVGAFANKHDFGVGAPADD